jgi:hypothetical protein
MLLEQYGLRGLATAPGSLPAVRQVTALGVSTQTLATAPLIILVLLFPDGRLPSRRWRPVLWGAIAVAIVGGTGELLQRGTVITGSLTNALDPAHVAYPNPFGIFPRHGWYSGVIAVVGVIAVTTAVLALASVFVRRRTASAELRQQLAWLAYVGVLTVVTAVVMVCYFLATASDTLLGDILFILTLGTPIFGIPLACAVAVLRYRLYDLDVVVKKTVVAALVAAAFTVIYVLLVVAVGAATGRPGSSPLTFVVAALAAVMLQPIRTRAGLLADRLVYGRRATPYEVLSEFSERMAGTYSTEDVLPRMARAGGGHRRTAGRGVAADGRQRAPGSGMAIPERVGARGSHGGDWWAGANPSRSSRSGAGHAGACRRGRTRAAGRQSGGRRQGQQRGPGLCRGPPG